MSKLTKDAKDTFNYMYASLLGYFMLIIPIILVFPVFNALKEAKSIQPIIFSTLAAGIGLIANLNFNYARTIKIEAYSERLNWIGGRLLDCAITFVYCVLGSLALLPIQNYVDISVKKINGGDKTIINSLLYNVSAVIDFFATGFLAVVLLYTLIFVLRWLAFISNFIINNESENFDINKPGSKFEVIMNSALRHLLNISKYLPRSSPDN